ncbi:MAG: hypothetical protein AAF399_13780 [Bacteroidota bacterium]
MTSFRIRPRFTYTSKRSVHEVQMAVQEAFDRHQPDLLMESIPGHLVFRIPEPARHVWSPQLSVNLEWDEWEHEAIIRGLYGPNPQIWAMFTFGYAVLSLLGVFIGIIGSSQWSLGKEAPILWTLPILLAGGVGLYFLSQFGQKMGAEQTFTLHHFIEKALGDRVIIR